MSQPAFDRFTARLSGELVALQLEGRFYTPNMVSTPQGPRVTLGGRSCINLCSNNYLGLAQDAQVIAAAHAALDRWGFGLGAGRVVCSMEVHAELEERLAAFKGREAALVCQTGYDTNLAALSTLAGEGDVILSDAANHASIVDGSRLARAGTERRVYPHADMEALEDVLRAPDVAGARTRFIVTDGVFSMDGDIAPLPEIVALAERCAASVASSPPTAA